MTTIQDRSNLPTDSMDVPSGICTWGYLTDHPCLISYDDLDHTHVNQDFRPWVATKGSSFEIEPVTTNVDHLRWKPEPPAELTRDAVTPCLRASEAVVIAFRVATKNPSKIRTLRMFYPELACALDELSDIWGECEE